MKTPKKIYCGNNGHGNLSFSTEKVYDTMEEYIRKSTLLEWAKEGQKVTYGFLWEDFIDKLNSL